MDSSHPLSRPTVAASRRPATPGHRVFGWALLALLACLWWWDVPRGTLSPWISAHMPWPGPGSKALTWLALFVDRLLIEASVCLPAALLLARAWPSRAVLGASLLAVEEVTRTALEVLFAPDARHRVYLLMALGLHALLLVAGAAIFRTRHRRS
jgi:hypothetical protein